MGTNVSYNKYKNFEEKGIKFRTKISNGTSFFSKNGYYVRYNVTNQYIEIEGNLFSHSIDVYSSILDDIILDIAKKNYLY